MHTQRVVLVGSVLLATIVTVAGCSSSSDGDPTPSATATVTTTAPPATATGAPVTGTPTTGSTGAAGSGGSTGGSGSTNASGPGLCTPTVMTFRVGSTMGAAGTSYSTIIATNASQQPCVTTGYPGLAALDASGRQIAQADRDNGGTGGTTITVQPGQQISASIAAASMGAGGAECPAAAAVLFTLPDNTDSTRIVLTLPACSNGIGIGPLVRGTTGR